VGELKQAREAVLSREESMSTGMQYGIAIPHGRTDAVGELVCAVGLKPEGIDFDSMDERLSRIFVLALSPLSAAAPHMQFMSTISQVLDEQGRTALLACDTAQEMYGVLTGERLAGGASFRAPGLLSRLTRGAEHKPQLTTFLRRDLLTVNLTGETKEDIVDELLALVAHGGALSALHEARAAILEREAQMSTGMEHGVAIPHARTDTVSQLVCAVGIKRDGIDYGSLDGEPSTIFVLTLTPTAAAQPHVQFMALITRALNADGRQRALSATTKDELWDALVHPSR